MPQSNSLRFLVVAGLLATATSAHLFLFASVARAADGLGCPASGSGDAIEDWRDTAVRAVVDGNYAQVSQALTTCFPSEKPKCLGDLNYYNQFRSGGGAPGAGGIGFTPDGAREPRTAAPEYLSLNSERDLPQEFSVKDGNGQIIPGQVKIPDGILDLARRKGWKAANYKTRSTGGFDSPPNLTLVAVPGADKDVFLQISPPPQPGENGNDPNPHSDAARGQGTLTIITVDRTKTPPLGQLRLLHKDEVTGGYTWNNNLHSQDCTSCHASPLRSISPRGYLAVNNGETRMTPEQERNISEMNNMMVVPELQWGSQRFGDYEVRRGSPIDSQPTGWAPPNSETRKEAFIKECAQNAPNVSYRGIQGNYLYEAATATPPGQRQISWQKIATAMNCVDCHNGKVRGVLHEGFSQSEIHFKLLVDRTMPFASENLNMDERLAVVNCLNKERSLVREKWRASGEWMKSQFCEDFNGGVGPRGNAPARITR